MFVSMLSYFFSLGKCTKTVFIFKIQKKAENENNVLGIQNK